ncbi:hypothetical protein SAMN05216420_102193 [Nitrosospira sp. Nl5]|uniref:hypothetical protein n=1 Tax=Nitrosospira sp. Nl5 TaxID=200120 RepID=UPI00088D6C23|nr:hypothetical protein [Nitrosospira sp. Nl5]SCY07137.1 hypothetical protein SAMN05216420_102193 [Nitrosospira sp. Nl5]
MGKDYDAAAAANVRSFVLRYMEAHGAETQCVRIELDQLQTILGEAVVRLTSSFETIGAYSTRATRRTVNDCVDDGETIPVAALSAIGANQRDPAMLTGGIESSVNEAITALQFYDIASQILAHAGRRIELLERMAGQLGQLPDTTVEELDHVLRNACAARGHNPAGQTFMSVGAMEFF